MPVVPEIRKVMVSILRSIETGKKPLDDATLNQMAIGAPPRSAGEIHRQLRALCEWYAWLEITDTVEPGPSRAERARGFLDDAQEFSAFERTTRAMERTRSQPVPTADAADDVQDLEGSSGTGMVDWEANLPVSGLGVHLIERDARLRRVWRLLFRAQWDWLAERFVWEDILLYICGLGALTGECAEADAPARLRLTNDIVASHAAELLPPSEPLKTDLVKVVRQGSTRKDTLGYYWREDILAKFGLYHDYRAVQIRRRGGRFWRERDYERISCLILDRDPDLPPEEGDYDFGG